MACESLHNLCAECDSHLDSIRYVIPEPFHKHPSRTSPVILYTRGNSQPGKVVTGYVKLLTDIGTAVINDIWADSDEPGSIHVRLTEANGQVAAEPIDVMIDVPTHLAAEVEGNPDRIAAILSDLPRLDGFEWNYEPPKSHANLSRLHWFDVKVKQRGRWQLCEIDIDAHKRYIGPGVLRFLRRTFHLLGFRLRVFGARIVYFFTLAVRQFSHFARYVSALRSYLCHWAVHFK